MLTPERHRIILDLLQHHEVVTIHEFVEATESSESTIRRDLSLLEKEKKLRRVHGGASLLHQKGAELSMGEKSSKFLQEKERIALYAANQIREGDRVYLDAGTTTLQMIPFITAKDIIVVTNGLPQIDALLEHNIPTHSIGGFVKPTTKAFIGRGALQGLEQFRFDKCFMGVNGIHADFGFSTPDPEEASIKELAMQLSQQCYVLADHSKFNEISFAKISDLSEAIIITNELEEDMMDEYNKITTVKVV